jgi:hypothetical protein
LRSLKKNMTVLRLTEGSNCNETDISAFENVLGMSGGRQQQDRELSGSLLNVRNY